MLLQASLTSFYGFSLFVCPQLVQTAANSHIITYIVILFLNMSILNVTHKIVSALAPEQVQCKKPRFISAVHSLQKHCVLVFNVTIHVSSEHYTSPWTYKISTAALIVLFSKFLSIYISSSPRSALNQPHFQKTSYIPAYASQTF